MADNKPEEETRRPSGEATPLQMEEGEAAPDYEATRAPAYTAEAPSGGPPSYESIYGRLKTMKDESDGNADYMRRVGMYLFCGTICMGLWIVVLFALPVAMIAIGSVYLKSCPIERYIPIYLIVAGVFGVLKAIANIIDQVRLRKLQAETGEEDPKRSPINPFDGCVNLFLVAWFIAGCYWIYHVHRVYQSEYEDQSDYCNRTLYLFAFWTQTIHFIIMIVVFLLCCCGCVFMCCVGLFKS